VRQLIADRPWLFEDGSYHIDISHLSSVVQMSIYLPAGEELELARELCAYGERLSTQFQYQTDSPFEDQYRDYGVYLSILAGQMVEEGLAHFHAKVDKADPETAGTRPAEVLVNLYMRLDRPAGALAVARCYLNSTEYRPMICPTITELCQHANDYQALADVARAGADPVNFLAGILGQQNNGNKGRFAADKSAGASIL
jgi:hypothetical protein